MIKKIYIVFILTVITVLCFSSITQLRAKNKTVKTEITSDKTIEAGEKKSTEENSDNQKKPDENTYETESEKNTTVKKSEESGKPAEPVKEIRKTETPATDDGKSNLTGSESPLVNAEGIAGHPEIILKAYRDAYPHLIAGVTKSGEEWTIRFRNGNVYHWAEGKLLPEKALPHSDKYVCYTIYPYNTNGRAPELYTKEKIESMRVKKQPEQEKKKKVIVPGVEGGIYKELYSITNRKSAKKQLTVTKLAGHSIRVHRIIAAKIKSIDTKIKKLSKTDSEVRSFLKSIGSIQGFNWRKIAGTDRMSNHSYGIAIDILPKKYRKKILFWGWEQEKNEDWMLLPQSSLWAPPEKVIKIFYEEGFLWGGHWDKYDTMHFEYRPELIELSRYITFDK